MKRLEDNELWKLASEITSEAYEMQDAFPDDEQWGMTFKLKGRAAELALNIAEAVGSNDPRDRLHSYGLARRDLFGIKNIYLIAKKTNIFTVEPETMIRLNKLTDEIDKVTPKEAKAIPKYLDQFGPGVKT